MQICAFHLIDAPTLHAAFHSSFHQVARQHYTTEQLQAWAPANYDATQWAERLRTNRPWVAEVDGCIAGFADVQPSGFIDHFFVAGPHAGRGVGGALMAQIHRMAQQAGMPRLWADVSLNAEPFFSRSGFMVEARQQVQVRGVVLANARMGKAVLITI